MKYRADIDGLRALAVLAVVQFHLFIPWLASGGYVGVDVFFVISGYLITGIIFEQFATGKYSIVNFYDRRIRRIFPALFAVYLFILVASFLLLYPSETDNIGKTILSSEFFMSNVFFSHSSNYFDIATKNNPALHTWSLSVEEQFYVFFPILLFAIRSFSLQAKKYIILFSLISLFGLGAWWVNVSQIDAFYLVQFRAWELLVGSALAVGLVPKTEKTVVVEAVAAAGLLAILYAIFVYDEATLFPGLSAALPVFGSAALIYAGGCRQNFVSRLMSIEPARRIGQISYSMYLWHWPIIVFYQYYFPFRSMEKLGLLAVIFGVSYLSWRFIEQPFRQPSSGTKQSKTFAVALASMAGIGTLAFNLSAITHYVLPVSPQVEAIVATLNADQTRIMRVGSCFIDIGMTFSSFDQTSCLKTTTDKPNVLIMGDSHAGHLYAGYHDAFPNVNIMQATASGCKPVLNSKGSDRCVTLMNFMQNEYLPTHHVNTIILSSQWSDADVAPALALAEKLKPFANSVVISGPIVEYKQSLPRLVANAVVHKVDPDLYAESYRYDDQKGIDAAFANLKLPAGIHYVSPYKALCTDHCRTTLDAQTPMQFDYGHLTEQGSAYLARKIGPEALSYGIN